MDRALAARLRSTKLSFVFQRTCTAFYTSSGGCKNGARLIKLQPQHCQDRVSLQNDTMQPVQLYLSHSCAYIWTAATHEANTTPSHSWFMNGKPQRRKAETQAKPQVGGSVVDGLLQMSASNGCHPAHLCRRPKYLYEKIMLLKGKRMTTYVQGSSIRYRAGLQTDQSSARSSMELSTITFPKCQ